jgi:signal peptidase II
MPDAVEHARKARHFWPVAAAVFLTDCATKAVAERGLDPGAMPHPVLGDLIRFTLVYNRGSAMSVITGPYASLALSVVSIVALVALWTWYRRVGASAGLLITALALVWGGAAGNLWDRLRASHGVVDFIDVGLGATRFWVFNVADAAITVGALMLAILIARTPPETGPRDGPVSG